MNEFNTYLKSECKSELYWLGYRQLIPVFTLLFSKKWLNNELQSSDRTSIHQEDIIARFFGFQAILCRTHAQMNTAFRISLPNSANL